MNTPAHQDAYLSMLDRSRLVRRILSVVFVTIALVISATGTAFAIHELADAAADVEGY
jgi:hypothetical protein